jgi:pimeloyl-ACP methyl ester carboxylesterase
MNWSHTARLRGAWVRVRGMRAFLRAAEAGDPAARRPAIVLVHGIFAASRYMVPLGRLLGLQHRVYAPDLPGFGRNRMGGTIMDIGQLAGWLADWHRAMGLGPAVYVGNSMGCQVIARLAAAQPRLARGIVLTGPTVDPRHRTWPAQAARLLLDAPRERVELMLISGSSALAFGPGRVVRMIAHVLADRIEQSLPLVRCPALVIRGEGDTLVPQRWAQEAAALLPRGRLVVVPRGGHAVNDSRAPAVAAITRRFIHQLAAGPRHAPCHPVAGL